MLTNDQINIRDPFVLVQDHRYYLYGTRGETCWGPADGFDVYVGDDLNSWEGPFVCFRNDGTFWADRNYWAPEVHHWRGMFFMFASLRKQIYPDIQAIYITEEGSGSFQRQSHPERQRSLWCTRDKALRW